MNYLEDNISPIKRPIVSNPTRVDNVKLAHDFNKEGESILGPSVIEPTLHGKAMMVHGDISIKANIRRVHGPSCCFRLGLYR